MEWSVARAEWEVGKGTLFDRT